MEADPFSKIPIDYLKKVIPLPILKKLNELGIISLSDLVDFDSASLSKEKYVRSNFIRQINLLKDWISDNRKQLIERFESQNNPIITFEDNPDLGNIKIEHIEELIPGILINKFNMLGIKYLSDLSKYSKNQFSSLRSVGLATIKELDDFLDTIKSNPNSFLEHALINSHGITIPSNVPPNKNPLSLFSQLVNEYLDIINKSDTRLFNIITYALGLCNKEVKNIKDISEFYEISKERVRQLVELYVSDIEITIKTGSSLKLRVNCRPETMQILKIFAEAFNKSPAITLNTLTTITKNLEDISLSIELSRYLMLFARINNYSLTGKVETAFTDETILINTNVINKRLFTRVAKETFKILAQKVIPVSEFDLIVALKRKIKKTDKFLLEQIANSLPEINVIQRENETYYFIRFDKLTSVSDMAERVLFENRNSMSSYEIVNEINRRLYLFKKDKYISKNSAQHMISRNKRVVPKGRTGYYFHSDLQENKETIHKLITKTILHHNKDLSSQEIVKEIIKIRPELNKRSLTAILGLNFLKLKNGNYILKDWRSKYDNDLAIKLDKEKKVSTIAVCQSIFNQKGVSEIPLKEVHNLLRNKYHLPISTINSTLYNKRFFYHNISDDGTKQIALKDFVPYRTLLKRDIIRDKIIEYLQNEPNPIRLNSLANHISSSLNANKTTIYRVITSNSELFNKSKKDDKILISLKKKPATPERPSNNFEVDWTKLRNELIIEVQEIFNNPDQPRYDHSIRDSIDLFYRIVSEKTGLSTLDGLEIQLIPTIYKSYFGQTDKNDLLNQFKQIATSLDPYIRKIIFLLNPDEYNNKKRKIKGLGSGFKELSRLDPLNVRYLEKIEDVSEKYFGKQIFIAYTSRNSVTHEAKYWSKQQIVNNITALMVVYFYSVCEYYDELIKSLNRT